ncbi:hypothetical protein CHLNCDRAFT_28788, partial [Chlorella variabilis]
QDVENFRENVKQGYLPLPTDVTFEGIAKDYYFDTTSNTSQPCTELFCPIYSLAAAPDPLRNASAARRRSLLQAASLQASDFRRPRLNLVLLLDVSGSMGESFMSYYYDAAGTQQNLTAEELNTTKIDVAKEVLSGVLDLLAPNDSVAIVLFSTRACTPQPLSRVSCLDIPALQAQIDKDMHATSSTSLSAGLDLAIAELKKCSEGMSASLTDTENRIMVITDQQPNSGDYTTGGLAARLRKDADDGIFTTIIGVGLDLNSELAESISKVRGANYYSVHRPGEFRRRLTDEFDFAVTPLVFDLSLAVDPGSLGEQGWKVLHVYGSPNPNDTALNAAGTITQVGPA